MNNVVNTAAADVLTGYVSRQGISKLGNELITSEYCGFITRSINCYCDTTETRTIVRNVTDIKEGTWLQ